MDNIIFMGTPEFAVPSLEALSRNKLPPLLVITQPDRPKGRGRKIIFPPVKECALSLGHDIYQPESMNSDECIKRITDLKPDLFIVVAFGYIFPEKILGIPRHGALNIHASLLPEYRGPAPIQRAIMNGDKITGVTAMMLDSGMDTGDILMSSSMEILPEDTSGSLHDRLALAGADLLIETLSAMKSGTLDPVPQNNDLATYAPILTKEDGLINWSMSAEMIESFIRGVTPWPGAFTFHGDKRLKIFSATAVSSKSREKPGTVIKGFPDELRITTGDGVLSILEIQSASGKRLPIKSFLQGYHMPPETILL